MTWRLAESLKVLRQQINDAYPQRRKSSDGTIGDEAHASRSSDHNPWVKDGTIGVVTAIDFTHDPANGVDAGKLAEAVLKSRDPRIKYVISNRRICSGDGGPSPWVWRKYTGSNPHTKHMHLSVNSDKKRYDSKAEWSIDFPKPKPKTPPEEKPLVKSKIAQASATVATVEAGDAISTANDVLSKIADTKDAVDRIGITDQIIAVATSPRFILAVLVVVICAGIIYWRWREHGRGRT